MFHATLVVIFIIFFYFVLFQEVFFFQFFITCAKDILGECQSQSPRRPPGRGRLADEGRATDGNY